MVGEAPLQGSTGIGGLQNLTGSWRLNDRRSNRNGHAAYIREIQAPFAVFQKQYNARLTANATIETDVGERCERAAWGRAQAPPLSMTRFYAFRPHPLPTGRIPEP